MNKLLQELLYKYGASLTAGKSDNKLVWVVQSTREGETFYCSFDTDDKINERETLDFYIYPALIALERSRLSRQPGDLDYVDFVNSIIYPIVS